MTIHLKNIHQDKKSRMLLSEHPASNIFSLGHVEPVDSHVEPVETCLTTNHTAHFDKLSVTIAF